MYTGLLHLHSFIRYVILLLPIAILIKLLINTPKRVEALDKRMLLMLLVAAHTQLIAGLLLYLQSPFVFFGEGMMKNQTFRYWTVEHGSLMFIVIVLFTLSYSMTKRKLSESKLYKRVLILTLTGWLLAIINIIASGRGLFTHSAPF